MGDEPSRISSVSRTSQLIRMYFLSVFSHQRVTYMSLCRSKLDFPFSEYLMRQSIVYNMITKVLTWQDTSACWDRDE